MRCKIITSTLLLVISQFSISAIHSTIRKKAGITRIPHSNAYQLGGRNPCIVRGGCNSVDEQLENNDGDTDEERYSRQLYTLGARAHSLVRLSTIVVDGPVGSGLVYESVKNLALSGVGKIVILTEDKSSDHDDPTCVVSFNEEEQYFNQDMDDLGIMYMRGARTECFPNDVETENVDNLDLILEYVRRLNPSVRIQTLRRSDFLSFNKSNNTYGGDEETESPKRIAETLGDNPVFLCADRPLTSQLLLNKVCRDNSIPFISIETAGVYGRVFCDFGEEFCVLDEDGESPKITLLEKIELNYENDLAEDGQITVYCVEGEHHDVSKGDVIEFQSKSDVELQLEVLYVKSPTCFTAKVRPHGQEQRITFHRRSIEAINQSANSFSRIKLPKKVSFLPLFDALKRSSDPKEDIFAASDLDKSFDVTRRLAIMNSFAALEKFVKKEGRLPDPLSERGSEDINIFVKLAGMDDNTKIKSLIHSFALYAKAKFMPLQAIFGALGAQEVLKAASGLYNPIKQFLLYDCDEVLRGVDKKVRKKIDNDEKVNAAGIKHILGKKLMKKLSSEKIFVVGSGAIGCEVLKNLASIEAGTRKKHGGSIILTDMDTIERSNLSRQLLFRDSDVGKFKSAAAQEAVQRLNPRVCMNIHTSKVGEDSSGKESCFDDKFWSDDVNIVMNALDNVEARLFMDSQCVANRKAMIDAGTLGAKGNVQVVVPCQSESYGSSVDPPEPTIAVCTLKNFPYEISHTIQWGRDLFDGLFKRRPGQVNEYSDKLSSTSVSEVSKILVQHLGEEAALLVAREMAEDFQVVNFDNNNGSLKEASIAWAVALSRELFYTTSKHLLRKHPLNSRDEDGEPFWAGTRRAPTPLQYIEGKDISDEEKKINEYIIDFVRYAARLRIENCIQTDDNGIVSDITVEEARLALQREIISKHMPDQSQSVEEVIRDNLSEAKRFAHQSQNELNILSFEKDDDSNGHVAFIASASNLRAIAYGIKPVDAMETRRIAGRIVPAMITTTALVSALSCIELVKLIQNAPLRSYKNAFVNLALPFFAFTAPLPAERILGIHGNTHTIWDRIVIKESKKSREKGGITLRRFIRQIKKKVADEEVEVSNISFGPYMLYANFLHEHDNILLDKSVFELMTEAILSNDENLELDNNNTDGESIALEKLSEVQQSEIKALRHRSFLDFTVLVEDPETGEEAELPGVRLFFFNNSTTV